MKFPKLTINVKLLLSYLSMALLTLITSAYAFMSLQNLNHLAYDITNNDYVILDTSKQMMDSLLAQESSGTKALIFKDASLEAIFWTRSQEFKAGLIKIRKFNQPGYEGILNRLEELQNHYNAVFQREWTLVQSNRIEEASALSEKEGKQILDSLIKEVRSLGKKVEQDINKNVRSFKDQSMRASRITIALSMTSLLFGIILAFTITYNIARPLKKLEKATALIAEGKFNNDLNMNRGDAIGSLARALIVMADRLKVLEAYHRDASPLTGLPGNLAIEKHINKRLAAKQPFALCHIDLDNFKPFVDHYGYAWGSEIIKEVGKIIKLHVQDCHEEEVFTGHIGGDDFVLIAEPETAERLCQSILTDFDKRCLQFYAEEDRKKGYFTGYDRSGNQRDFPLITMTIAIASDDGSRFKSPLEISEMAAQLKEYAKSLPGSNYVKMADIEHLLYRKGTTPAAGC